MRLIPPLRHRAVALLWGGLAFSAVGDRAYDVAFAWIAAEVFGANAGFLVALGPLATQRAGLPLASYGLVIPAYGCTNLIANSVVGSRPMTERPGGQIFAGNVCLGLGILALGGAATLPAGWLMPAAMAASGLAAVGGPMQDIAVAVLRQTALARGDAGVHGKQPGWRAGRAGAGPGADRRPAHAWGDRASGSAAVRVGWTAANPDRSGM